MSFLTLAFLLAPASALADGVSAAETQAEANRLEDEIEKLADRKAWAGVERNYQALIATGVPMDFEYHVFGAEAATHLGDVAAARERLLAANQIREDRMVLDWLWTIDTSYGSVNIQASPGAKLDIAQLPFDPRAATAYRKAADQLETNGAFTGFLPEGTYQVGNESFTIEVGRATRVSWDEEPDTKKKKKRK